MAWVHVQGTGADINVANATFAATFASTPTAGNIVIAAFYSGSIASGGTITCSDGTNTYTPSASTPFTAGVGIGTFGLFYLKAPSGAGKTITGTWNTTATGCIYIDEFSNTGSGIVYDKDNSGTFTNTGTTFNGLTLTPTVTGELLYALGGTDLGSLTAPTSGGTLGIWTGAAFGPETHGADAEYVLGASTGSQAVNFTDSSSGDSSAGMIIAFKLFAGDDTYAPTFVSLPFDPTISVWQ